MAGVRRDRRRRGSGRRIRLRTAVLGAAITALFLATGAQAQSNCTRAKCSETFETVKPVVDGCGEHAAPGRFKITLSSTDSSITRSDFPTVIFITPSNEYRSRGATTFSEWEWRNVDIAGGWQAPPPGGATFGLSAQRLGENIFEVRPTAGAHVWSNRNASNPQQGPGELVVHILTPGSSSQVTVSGSAYFLFMGGKGCARVNEWGEKTSGNQ